MAFDFAGMAVWLIFAVLTGAAIWAVLRPLMAAPKDAPASEAEFEVTLYRDQLAEIDRDLSRGTIGEAEAESARLEVSRRLLAADEEARKGEPEKATGAAGHKWVALGIIVLVPLFSLGIYLMRGAPDIPDQPLLARLDKPAQELPLPGLIAKVERHLKEHPDDAQGWAVLAPAYMRIGQADKAVAAVGRLMAIRGESADLYAERGQLRVLGARGEVTDAAREDFRDAVKLNPGHPKANYYLGLAEVEDGKKQAAETRWQRLVDTAPEDAPWLPGLKARLAELKSGAPAAKTPPGPSAADVDAASRLSPEQRRQMIEGMVARLASKLEDEPGDLAGWQRLIRAYRVLGDDGKADAALKRAKTQFADDRDALKQLDAAARTQQAPGAN
ncbi:cytochrome c-type biogenesis protein CcmH [Parvibaculum indicum]|uniref:c-type cytochrome biogenesis protein CcmI n=1 Tax=Parvibaculum indicum TaxID=562969 RepID=UPI00141E4E02|nr:c-type cytochrome biogenesis protein CcmI [Parvibaculum indicum]NIJ41918.1 cytochrome c-type biogenesis protein CcmH [Parvibaculum indicum]